MMRLFALMLAVCALFVLVPVAFAQTPPAPPPTAPPTEPDLGQPTLGDDKDTIDAGQKWLALIDAGKAGVAWDSSSALLKSAVPRQKWITGMRDARKPFGKLVSRTPTRFARTHTMPNAPEGDYAIIEYETVFANGKHATEHLTWMLEDVTKWRVSGYYIR